MPHTDTRDYFVSMVDGARRALLAGPYPTHTEALAAVRRATDAAIEANPRYHWCAFGTCSLPAPSGYVGKLNAVVNQGVTLPQGR